jgi:nucleoside-diphosphate-sugar epimerase
MSRHDITSVEVDNMRIFVTGASGWMGSGVVPELLAAGHTVTGLARSDASAAALEAAGAGVHRGSLDDVDSLVAGAATSDGVIHLAFKHDFSDYAGAGRSERAAVEAMLGELEGSDRPFLIASGVALLRGKVATEDDRVAVSGPDSPRGGSENLAFEYASRGVRTVSLRFSPTVHGEGDHGFIGALVDAARRQGVSGYVGDGTNRWPAVHRSDAARLVRLALEGSEAGTAVHAVAEEGVAARAIAEAIGAQLGLPVRSIDPDAALEHFGWIGGFFALDVPASSAITQATLGWAPTGPTLLEDLQAGHYTR